MATLPISVQLYTLRDLTAKDMPGTLKRLAAIGYKYVEVAGYGNLTSAAEMRKALDDAKLKASGAHVGLEDLEKDFHQAVGNLNTLGTTNLIVPWIDPKRRTDGSAWSTLADIISRFAAPARAAKLELLYHNHDFEFATFDGKTAMDILLGHLDRQVKFELDVFWVKFAGLDPVGWIERLSGRLPLIHLKDMAAGKEKKFAQVGTGVLDFPAIVNAASRAGVKFGVVEQDDTYGVDPLKAVQISLQNLKKMQLVE
jgi:sugar phosphate isomerase/epimerase